MANKAKIKRTKKRKQRELLVTVEAECALDIQFSPQLQDDPEIIRRLAHRVVDLLADSGRYVLLADGLASDLGCIADDIVVKNMTDLIREARTPRKAVPRA